MEFETYLRDKKIDPIGFRKAEPNLWSEFQSVFLQVHPKSFTSQKLYLINGIRRKYPLPSEEVENRDSEKKRVVKPKVKVMPTGGGSKPVVKPKLKPKTTGDSKSVIKPKGSKPKVSNRSEESAIEKKEDPVVKPKMILKPKVKPKIKPKIARPVLKPKPKSDEQNTSNKDNK